MINIYTSINVCTYIYIYVHTQYVGTYTDTYMYIYIYILYHQQLREARNLKQLRNRIYYWRP